MEYQHPDGINEIIQAKPLRIAGECWKGGLELCLSAQNEGLRGMSEAVGQRGEGNPFSLECSQRRHLEKGYLKDNNGFLVLFTVLGIKPWASLRHGQWSD